MESIFRAIPKILDGLETNQDAREAFVFAAWRRSVGDLLNEHTTPVALRETRLRVAVANRMWQRHLETMAAEMLAKLNASLGRVSVKFIEFYIDEKALGNDRSDHRVSNGKPDQIARQISEKVLDAAEAINDDKLRDAFIRAAASCIEREERMNKTI